MQIPNSKIIQRRWAVQKYWRDDSLSVNILDHGRLDAKQTLDRQKPMKRTLVKSRTTTLQNRISINGGIGTTSDRQRRSGPNWQHIVIIMDKYSLTQSNDISNSSKGYKQNKWWKKNQSKTHTHTPNATHRTMLRRLLKGLPDFFGD